jgi:hypothetical protein
MVEEKADNPMAIKPSGFDQREAHSSNHSPLVPFAATAGESVK